MKPIKNKHQQKQIRVKTSNDEKTITNNYERRRFWLRQNDERKGSGGYRSLLQFEQADEVLVVDGFLAVGEFGEASVDGVEFGVG